MPDIVNSEQEALGITGARGVDFEGDLQRLSFDQASEQERYLESTYSKIKHKKVPNRLPIKDMPELDMYCLDLTREEQRYFRDEIEKGLAELASYRLSGADVGSLHITADFLNSHYVDYEGRKVSVGMEDPELASLAGCVAKLSYAVGLAEKSLPPNAEGYFPGDDTSAPNKDDLLVQQVSLAKDYLLSKFPPDSKYGEQFDKIVDRIEKERPQYVDGRRVGQQELVYIKTPPAEYSESK